MTVPTKSHKTREQLVAMVWGLQANRIVLDRLLKCYGVFRFTGGVVPDEPWDLVAITSYLQCPFAAERISTAAIERYRHLAETIVDLGQAITAGERPRSLRCRHDIAHKFGRGSSEIRELGSKLESAITKLVEEMEENPATLNTKGGSVL